MSAPKPTPAAPRPRRKYLRVVLALAIFLSGAVAGAGGTVLALRGIVLHGLHHPEDAAAWVSNRLGHRFNLNAEGTAHVSEIITKHLRALEAIRQEFRPRIDEQLLALRDEVAAQMGEPEASRWKKNFDELRERWTPAEVPAVAPPPAH